MVRSWLPIYRDFRCSINYRTQCSGNLTHWGRVTHICVSKLNIIGSDNGLSPERRQANIWTNAWILLIGPSGTNFSEILIGIHTFSFKKIHLKMSSAKWRPFCLGLNDLKFLTSQDASDYDRFSTSDTKGYHRKYRSYFHRKYIAAEAIYPPFYRHLKSFCMNILI